jgi:hypothetical protein
MGQVNVNPPAGGPVQPVGEPPGSAGAGMILGIIVAIIVIALLVYFLLLNPGGGGTTDGGGDGGGGGTEPTEPAEEEPAPSGWRLTQLA